MNKSTNTIVNRKFIITHTETEYTKPAQILTVLENDKPTYLSIIYDDEECDLNNIYIAHVNDIVKNIDGAFLEYSKGKIAYMSLKESKAPIFINTKNTSKICQGDNILVQLIKEPIKTKNGVVTSNITLNGKYLVFEYNLDGKVNISKKIKDKIFIENITNALTPLCDNCGFIVRTKAETIDIATIVAEANELKCRFDSLVNKAMTRTTRTLIERSINPNYEIIIDLCSDNDNIITDNQDIIDELKNNLNFYDKQCNISLYEDKLLPLYKLYNLEGIIKDASSRIVWLKSGAYLVIDYTEAMTVIDVNTGKCIKGKGSDKTFFDINIEAASEIMRQLKLRNISGIIICDFINMTSDEYEDALLSHIKLEASKDRLKTNILDMTKLKLLEITRKKTRDRLIIKK